MNDNDPTIEPSTGPATAPTGPAMRGPRPISIPHLVFGLVFLGIAAVWSLGKASGADLPRTAVGFPAVLIGAGLVGLIATVVNNRRRYRANTATITTTAIEEEQ